jgi:UPF0755 protein
MIFSNNQYIAKYSKHPNAIKYLYGVAFVVFLSFAYVFSQVLVPKSDFPVGRNFEIKKDDQGGEVIARLQKEGYIKSIFWGKVIAKVFSKVGKDKFYRGEYVFEQKSSTYDVIYTVTKRPASLAVLIPEGFTKKQVAERLAKYIRNFDKTDFLKHAQEGYLFPETYYFFSFSTNEEILAEFEDKFNTNTLASFGRTPTKNEVIIASMLEREARDPKDMKIISGIIQNRLKIGMALQIDATVLYGKGAWKERVLYADLRHESDYNTYTNTGLPIGPISNPGINALSASMFPQKNSYFYYLTGRDGKMYYAKTHDEHVANKAKYLR